MTMAFENQGNCHCASADYDLGTARVVLLKW